MLQNCQRFCPGLQQNLHGIFVVIRGISAGELFHQICVVLGAQNQPGGLRAGQFQSVFPECTVIMAQARKFTAGLAKGIVAQLRLNAAQAVTAPHGTAAVFDGHHGTPIRIVLQNGTQAVTQCTGQAAVVCGGAIIDLHFPFFTAAVQAQTCNAAESIIISRFTNLHNFS